MKHAVGQDSETESTEHCPKYKQSTVTQIQLQNRPVVKTSKTSNNIIYNNNIIIKNQITYDDITRGSLNCNRLDEMCVLGDVCCAVYFVNYISALQGSGEADVKRDLDYSRSINQSIKQFIW